jgi:hypothetical protein
MHVDPQKQHAWLQQLIGRWTSEAEMSMGEGQPPQTCKGTETVRALGRIWIVAEGEGEMPGGGEANTMMTLGFEPRTGRFVGTWVGSMMTHLWVYDGWLEENETRLVLEAEGPSFTVEGGLASYRDIIELRSPDHRVLTSHLLQDDGSWQQFMTAHYRRQA